MKTKKEELQEILCKAKFFITSPERNKSFSAAKSFGIEAIEKDNEIENSIPFQSLEEATETIWSMVPNNEKDVVLNHIEDKLNEKGFISTSPFRLLFHLT